MKNIELIRAAILMVLAPLCGLGTLGYLVAAGQLRSWHAPLIVMLVFGPVIAWDKVAPVGRRLKRIGDALSDDPPEPGKVSP